MVSRAITRIMLIAGVAIPLHAACGGVSQKSGGETNWLACHDDADCRGGDRCLSGVCVPSSGGDAGNASDSGGPAALRDAEAGVSAPDSSLPCSDDVAWIKVSNPVVVGGSVTSGQSATIRLSITNTKNSAVLYAGALLTTQTPGVTVGILGLSPGMPAVDALYSLGSGATGTLASFTAAFSSSLPRGTTAVFVAKAIILGYSMDCPNQDMLQFTLTVQ